MFQNTANTIKEEKNWTRIDYSGLATITFKEIKEDANKNIDIARNKYINQTYIFTTTILEINGNEIITPIEENDYSGS